MSAKCIYLIGFMGSGKTTIGHALAKALHYEFVDMDHYIEKQQQLSIADIFMQQGEESFRLIESQALDQLSKDKNIVISTGGGTPCFHDNMSIIRQSGVSIYLKCSIDSLHQRLKHSQERPLVSNKSDKELKRYIRETLSTRKEFYQKADIRVIADVEIALLLRKILKKISHNN